MFSRVRRGSALGVPLGRLRGGFQASLLPGYSPDDPSTVSENSTANSSPNPSLSPNSLSDLSDVNTADLSVTVQSIYLMCKTMSEQMKRMEQRVGNLEQKQIKNIEALKELSELMKKQERSAFSIKVSPFEVLNYHL